MRQSTSKLRAIAISILAVCISSYFIFINTHTPAINIQKTENNFLSSNLEDTVGILQAQKKIRSKKSKAQIVEIDFAKLEVPSGALLEDTLITLTTLSKDELPPLDIDLVNVTKNEGGVRCLPHGLQFTKEVSLSLAYDFDLIPSGYSEHDIQTFYYDDERKRWMPIPRDTLLVSEEVIASITTHFTDFINGIIKTPDAPETQAYTPTSIKDLKAGDASSEIELIQKPAPNNMSTTNIQYPLKLPVGRQGIQPSLILRYNSERGNGPYGLNWDISIPSISIDTRWGVPRYDPNLETETYIIEGSQLSPVAHRDALVSRTVNKVFHPRVEGEFKRIVRHGNNPTNYWWEVTDKKGVKKFYGGNSDGFDPTSVLTDDLGNIATWKLKEVRDLNDNFIQYYYDEVIDSGVLDNINIGRQMYIDRIAYTGHGTEEGKYTVQFYRDRDLNGTTRDDVIISCRLGFKQVTADLFQKIEISYNDQLIRSYELEYIEGVFYKQLLSAIIEKDTEGQAFYRHDFEYYNEVSEMNSFEPLGDQQTWEIEDRDLHGDIPIGTDFNGETSALGGTTSSSRNIGGAVTVGPPILCGNKQLSIGVNFSSGRSNSTGLVTLLDINGDNLPDKVFRENGALYYNPNMYNVDGSNYSFGDMIPIIGMDHFSKSSTSTSSLGFEINAFAFIGRNSSESETKINTYISDFNADGLMDIANGNQAFFNTVDTINGISNFNISSDLTPNPIVAGAAIDSTLVTFTEDEREYLRNKYPLHDVVRVWRAPYDGTISIEDDIQRIQPENPAIKSDSLRYSIESPNGSFDEVFILPNDFNIHNLSIQNIQVEKGQLIFFRLQSVNNGEDDEIFTNPRITYQNIPDDEIGPNGQQVNHFIANEDFLVASPQVLSLPYDGRIVLDGTFQKPHTSDSIKLQVIRTHNDTDYIEYEKDFLWNQEYISFQVLDSIDVDSSNDLRIQLLSNTNVEWSEISFTPNLYYIEAENYLGEVDVLDSNDQPRFVFCPTVEYSILSEIVKRPKLVTVIDSGTVSIQPAIGDLLPLVDQEYQGKATLSVKGTNSLYAEKTYNYIVNNSGQNLYPSESLEVNLDAGDQIYIEWHYEDRALYDEGVVLNIQPIDGLIEEDIVGVITSITEKDQLLGHLYRGWGQFIYNTGGTWDSNLIDPDDLELDDDVMSPPSQSQIQNMNSADLDNLYNPAYAKFIVMVGDSKENIWRGYDDKTWIGSDSMSSSRMGRDDVSLDFTVPSNGTGLSIPDKISMSNTKNRALGFDIPGIPIPVDLSGNYSTSETKTETILDLMDMNGDGYPDIIGRDKIQYTLPRGDREAVAISYELNGSHVANAIASAWTLGGNFPNASTNNTNFAGAGAKSPTLFQPAKLAASMFKCEKATETSQSSLGINANVSFGNNEDETEHTWLDINGDGLPDKVMKNDSVSLNLGYKFLPPEKWGFSKIRTGESEDFSAGGGIGINIVNLSIAAGVGLSRTDNKTNHALQDINGDGLVDILILNDPLKVLLNTGNGFSADTILWNNVADISKGSSTGETANLGVTFCIHLLPGFPVVKICASLNGSVGNGVSREHFQISDINGDGYPDVITSDNDGDLETRLSTIGRTNLLKRVNRPLHSYFTIDYERAGNTYDLPQNHWVMSRVETFDGFEGDGADWTKYTFEYEDGYYDRREREFYGFKKVIATQLDGANIPYRSIVSTYKNRNYYTKGLLESETTEDGTGNKYIETVNTYEVRDLNNLQPQSQPVQDDENAYFPALIETEKLFYEGMENPGLQTSTNYDYDAYGNIIYYQDIGDGDEEDIFSATIAYHDIDANYIKSSPRSIRVILGPGLDPDNTIRYRETDIDENNGNVIQIRQYLKSGNSAIYDMEYFDDGNLRKITRPKNHKEERLWYLYEYDDEVMTYVTKISDAYGYSSSNTYNYLFGQLLESTDINNQQTRYEIDNKGRISTITGPYEIASGLSTYTIKFEFYPDEQVPYAITKHFDQEFGTDIETITYIDGLKRPIQIKKTGAIFGGNGNDDQIVMIVSGRIHFDAFGRTNATWYPTMEPLGNLQFNETYDNITPTTNNFDILDRVTSTTLPDGTDNTTTYSIDTDNEDYMAFRASTTDALDNIREKFTDVRNRQRALMALGPDGEIWTGFRYNAISELIAAIDVDSNVTRYSYDQLGRKLSYEHPDGGRINYGFDLVGNQIRIQTAEIRNTISDSAFIHYTYDHERLVEIDYPKNYQNKVQYKYGAPGASHNRAGRIELQQDASGGHEYFYGPLGEVIKDIRTILIDHVKMETYVWQTEYDTWNRVQKMIYPDGEVVDYAYNQAGKISRLTSRKDQRDYTIIDQLAYDKFEQRVFLKSGNGTETQYFYDEQRRWLDSVNVQGTLLNRTIMACGYTYDVMANIKSIANTIPIQALKLGGPSKHNYQYDDLYRLISASGNWTGHNRSENYSLTMQYDNLHNITQKKQEHFKLGEIVARTTYTNQYTYGANKPHAPDTIGQRAFTYDSNGNFTGWNAINHFSWRKILWDEDNRISAISDNGFVSQYTYDASGERAIKSSGGVQSTFNNAAPAGFIGHQDNYTAYVSPYLVSREGRFTKHYYIEGQRVASRIGQGRFINRYHHDKGLTAGSKDYSIRSNLLKDAIRQRYKDLNTPPGIPTSQGHLGEPDANGLAIQPIPLSDSSYNIPPIDWVISERPTTGTPGIPIPPPQGITNGTVEAGYGFNHDGPNPEESNQYFFHPDHLGSTSYVTDRNGEIRQHLEYMPFGETFIEEHTSDGDQPYLFNAKELDRETGLYYYGARYYDPMTSMWASIDPMAEKYPGWSPYNYTLQNPIKFIDPDGKIVAFAEIGLRVGVGEILPNGSVLGASFSASVGIAIDDNGKKMIYSKGGFGPFSGIMAGLGISAGVNNAPSVENLKGRGVDINVNLPSNTGIEVNLLPKDTKKPELGSYKGITFSKGIGGGGGVGVERSETFGKVIKPTNSKIEKPIENIGVNSPLNKKSDGKGTGGNSKY